MLINNEQIKNLRIQNGLTLKDVAIRLNVSEGTVSRYESGQIKRVSPNVVLGYSKLFNVPIGLLYENPKTEWVEALEEAGLQDPRVAGFIEYLEEKAQKESIEKINLTDAETALILAYRNADSKTRQIVDFALNTPSGLGLKIEAHIPLADNKGGDSDA